MERDVLKAVEDNLEINLLRDEIDGDCLDIAEEIFGTGLLPKEAGGDISEIGGENLEIVRVVLEAVEKFLEIDGEVFPARGEILFVQREIFPGVRDIFSIDEVLKDVFSCGEAIPGRIVNQSQPSAKSWGTRLQPDAPPDQNRIGSLC